MRPSPLGGHALLVRGSVASVAVALLALWPAPSAGAEPTPTPPAAGTDLMPTSPAVRRDPNLGPAHPGQPVCTMTDPRLLGVSGMVATATGFVVVNDQAVDAPAVHLFFLNASCAVVRVYTHNRQPRDPEDLALGPDGALWIADIGDNHVDRTTVTLWRVPADQGPATMYRLTYPDGAHDAEALLFDGDGRPLIITKTREDAGIYRPTRPLVADSAAGVPMAKVGEFAPHDTRTSNPFWIAGEVVVTGAATAPGGARVVLRTYSDAYEFDVVGGDVVASISHGTARITPLPDEPQGESISYSPDGSSFLTASDTTKNRAILRYVPFVPAPPATATPEDPVSAAGPPPWLDTLTFSELRRIMAGGGIAGAGLLLVGILGIRSARRRRAAAAGDGDGGGHGDGDPAGDLAGDTPDTMRRDGPDGDILLTPSAEKGP